MNGLMRGSQRVLRRVLRPTVAREMSASAAAPFAPALHTGLCAMYNIS